MPRPPKSTAEHIASGTFQKCRHGDRSDLRWSGVPKMPADLSPAEQQCWELLLEHIPPEALAGIDVFLLTIFAKSWSLYLQVAAEVDQEGADRLLVTKMCNLINVIEKLGSRFGLSPSDRAKLRISPPAAETNAVEELLAARRAS